MKKIAFAAFAALAFFGCKNAEKPAPPIIEIEPTGDWANDLWLGEIAASHSPQKAQLKGELATLSIKKAGDGLVAAVSFNHHEGGEFIFQKAEKGWKVFENQGDGGPLAQVFRASVSADGKSLKLRTDSTEATFSKYLEPLDYRVVGGEYSKKGDQKAVVFRRDGTVEGLEPFHFYGVFFDYFGGPEQFDQLWLSATGEKGTVFGFEKSAKTFTLRATRCKKKGQKPCEEIEAGEVAFELLDK